MVFSTYFFLAWFLPLALGVYFALPVRLRNGWLAVSSYVFYGWARPEYCLLLAGMTAFNYWCGARIWRAADERARRRWLVLSIVGSLSLLGFFKYAGMLSGWLAGLLSLTTGAPSPLPVLDVVLPIGISFYTFQAISYTVDIHRGHAEPADDLISFAAYIAMFPQLIAGPIVRYETIAEQLRERRHGLPEALLGARFFAIGLAKKALLADTFALAVPAAFETADPGFFGAWLGVLGYTLQIYFDFSAYSDMAVGIGLVLGFHFPKNFDSPYRSASITEFWRRWHISLSTWLRDYLYLPLGGNRRGATRTYVNLMIVMLLGGLWHGASVAFLLWGLWHGALLAIERRAGARHPARWLPQPLAIALTQLLVVIGWVPFCAGSLANGQFDATMAAFDGMFATAPSLDVELAGISPLLFWLVPLGVLACVALPNSWAMVRSTSPLACGRDALLGAAALVAVLSYQGSPFLYFQF